MGLNMLVYYLVVVPSVLLAITGHEFAHAWVAFSVSTCSISVFPTRLASGPMIACHIIDW